jgi:predicted DNA-binding transcriptional regulator AlpA
MFLLREHMQQKRYLRPKQAADYIGIPTSTLAKRRLRGDAPEYIKIGKAVFYDIEVLDRLMASRRRRSTSDTSNAAA